MNGRTLMIRFLGALGGALLLGSTDAALRADVAPDSTVRVEIRGDTAVLLRGGQPYFAKGVGQLNERGPETLAEIRERGAMSIRTWGEQPQTPALMDTAQRLGLSVCFGIWLQHEGPYFSYLNREQYVAEMDSVHRTVARYRKHPALLVWGVGNEIEGFDPADYNKPDPWLRLQAAAELVKKLDPDHPTMAVIAEIGGDKVRLLHELCPSIDIIGINTYGGAATLPQRYRAAGGTKPYMVTEFGPRGTWEVEKTTWNAPIEPTSTQKSVTYRAAYVATAVQDNPGLCLGSYAFIWGAKQEMTATWYGMFLKDGSRLEAVDVMQELWSGRLPGNRVPRIESIAWTGEPRVAPGTRLAATLQVVDPEGDRLTASWTVLTDTTEINLGGAAEYEQAPVRRTVAESSLAGATLRAPKKPGPYRLFVVVKDKSGGAAAANLPFLVEAAAAP